MVCERSGSGWGIGQLTDSFVCGREVDARVLSRLEFMLFESYISQPVAAVLSFSVYRHHQADML